MGFETSLGMELEMTEFLILCQGCTCAEPDFYSLTTPLPPPSPHHLWLVKEHSSEEEDSNTAEQTRHPPPKESHLTENKRFSPERTAISKYLTVHRL